MYTKEQINNDRKHYLKEMKQNALQLLRETEGTDICWEVSCEYDLDKWDNSIIEVCKTEKEAINMLEVMVEEGCELFYRPVVIDSDSGKKVTFQNLHYYKKDSYFVKTLFEF